MSKKVEELMMHEKYKGSSEEDLHAYLKQQIRAYDQRSIYAFGLNRKRPGYFNLSFVANKDSPIQTWPVKATPTSFVLFETETGSVQDLCNAFKQRYKYESLGGPNMGGRTPYGGRTPAMRTPLQPAAAAGGGWTPQQRLW